MNYFANITLLMGMNVSFLFIISVAKETIDIMTGLFFGGFRCDQLSVMQYLHLIATCGSWNSHIAAEGTGKIDVRIKVRSMQNINTTLDISMYLCERIRRFVDRAGRLIWKIKLITVLRVKGHLEGRY